MCLEATAIYYGENDIQVDISKFDVFNAEVFYRRRGLIEGKVSLFLHPTSTANWEALKNGLQAFHERRIPKLLYSKAEYDVLKTAARAFKLVHALEGVPWAQISEAPEVYKVAGDGVGRGWRWVGIEEGSV